MVVFRKVISTLVLFFIKFSSEWPLCVSSVISTLSGKLSTGGDDITSAIQNLNQRQLILSLEFCQTLLEETQAGKLSTSEEFQVNAQLKNNISSLALLLRYCCVPTFDSTILENVFKTYSLYGSYPVMEVVKTEENLIHVTQFLFELLEKGSNEPLVQNALEEVTTILEKNPQFYSNEIKLHLAKILVNMGRPLIELISKKNQEIVNNSMYIYSDDDMDEVEDFAKSFAKITISLCEAELRHPDRLSLPELLTLFDYLLVISNFPGIPYVDHTITMETLEFWNTYADSLEEEPDVAEYNPILLQVIEVFWRKSTYPIFKQEWNHELREAFDSFRRDFWDFLELSYNLIGGTLFSTLTNNICENLSMTNIEWLKIEASLSCITTLADSIPISNEYELLCQLFSSGLLSKVDEITDPDVKMTIISFVGAYDNFFELEIGKPFLFSALDFLFKSLNTTVLSNSTSKSILKLCSSNRSFLSGNFQVFFNTYVSMQLYKRLENIPHQRTVLAISSIAQSLNDIDTKASYISQLLDVIIQELEQECQLYNKSPDDQLLSRIVSLLKCISSVGKGLQEPSDLVALDHSSSAKLNEFWNKDEKSIKTRIIKVIEVISLQPEFNNRIDINEACCEILKAGFLEKIPGPFVFSPDTIVQFITTKISVAELFSLIADFTSCFVTSCLIQYSENKASYINTLVDLFFSFSSGILKDDPEAQTAYLKLHYQIVQQHLESFLQNKNAFEIIKYVAFTLASQERFVLRESTKFWTVILKSSNQQIAPHIDTIGPTVVEILTRQISGESARSELDYYIDVIRQLTLKHTMKAKLWFEKSLLTSPSPLVEKVTRNQRRLIFQQLITLRGDKQTASVIREYWLNARGIVDYI